jgi:trk system potassium uptake protein
MNVIVVGCGRVGAELALILSRHGHDVTVIDHVGSSFSHLDPGYRGRTTEDEPLSEGVLEKAGIREADALAAVTNSDAVNAVVAHVARTVYGVQNVVARNYDPRWRVLHEAMGLQSVSSTAWGAQRIEELLERPRLRAVFSAGNGEVELYEVAVPEAWAGRTVADFVEGLACSPVSLTHGGRASLPEPGQPLVAGDVLHVTATHEGAAGLGRRLEGGGA